MSISSQGRSRSSKPEQPGTLQTAASAKSSIKPGMMVVSGILVCCLALAVQWTRACHGEVAAREDGSASDPEMFVVGNDGPADSETQGYFINHIGLNTHDLGRMKNFYGEVLGMRHMFDVHLTPEFTVSYMGFAQGGRNGTGFQSGAELTTNKNNLAGLIEFTQFTPSNAELEPATKKTNNFGHIGLIEPDLKATQARVERYGGKILKRFGEPASTGGPVAEAYNLGTSAGEHEAAIDAVMQAQVAIGFDQLLLFQDPDGNLVEVQQLYMPGVL